MSQVVTRCRANYQQKQWDEAVLSLGLFSVADWQDIPSSLRMLENTGIEYLNRLRIRYSQISPWVRAVSFPKQVIDADTLACLQTALEQDLGQQSCRERYFAASAYQSRNTYFEYKRESSQVTAFQSTDACESFSGGLTRHVSGGTFPLMIWSGNSANRVPVAQEHLMIQGDTALRHATAESALQNLLQEISAYLLTVNELSEDVSATSWSSEGDTILSLIHI